MDGRDRWGSQGHRFSSNQPYGTPSGQYGEDSYRESNEHYGDTLAVVEPPPPQESRYAAAPASMRPAEEQDRESTIARLEKNLRDLQQERLGALDNFQPRNDGDLKEDMMKLQSQVTSVSRSLLNSAMDLENFRWKFEQHTLTNGSASGVRLSDLLESVVWKLLMIELFDHPFQPFGENGEKIKDAWCLIFRKGHYPSMELPAASETSEKWRSITACHLYEQMSQEWRREREEVINRVTTSLGERLLELTDGSLDRFISRESHLQKMVEKGWEIATTFAQQRCRLELWASQTHPNYNETENWRVNVLGKLDNGPDFIFTVSPALLKWGNGYGQDLEQSLVIVKSKVILGR